MTDHDLGAPLAAVTDDGKMWAVLCYLTMIMGLPLAIIPLVQRDDDFALYHARHALAAYLAFTVVFVLFTALTVPLGLCTLGMSTIVTLPATILMLLWPLAVTVHGVILTINGERSEPVGVFGLGDMMFGNVVLKEGR